MNHLDKAWNAKIYIHFDQHKNIKVETSYEFFFYEKAFPRITLNLECIKNLRPLELLEDDWHVIDS